MSRIATRIHCVFLAGFSLICITILNTNADAREGALPLRPYASTVDGAQMVVGAPWANDFSGAAYVLERQGATWALGQMLSPPMESDYARFGSTVAFDGTTIAIGAPWQDMFRGAVYVYEQSGNEWELRQTLTLVGAEADSRFGSAISISDGTLAIAGYGATDAAYHFERQGEQWVQTGVDARGLTERVAVAPGAELLAAFELVSDDTDAASVLPLAPGDTLMWVTASDGVFEDRVEVKWSPVESGSILYKILRDGVLIAAASSDDSLYNDTTGDRGVTYDYCVVVQDLSSGEAPPKCDTGSRKLRAPTHLVASDGEYIDGVHLNWDDRSSFESGYYVKRDAALIATLVPNKRSYVDTTAVPLTVYSYDVIAFDSNADESLPDTDDGFRGVVLPPLEVTATDGEFADSVRVTWVDQSNEVGFIVTRQNLMVPDSTVLDTTLADVQTYFDNTAQLGVRYKYCVFALDGIGQLSVPGCDDGGIDLVAPTNVAASDSIYDDRVQVTWEDESGIASGYYVWRDGAPFDSVGAAVRTYDDLAAIPDSTHTYCVIAFNSNGGMSAQNCDDGLRMIILAPTNVQASDGDYEKRTEITWESTSTTGALFTIFRDGVAIKSVSSGTRMYSDVGGTSSYAYVYGVQASTGLLDTSTTTLDIGHRELRTPINVSATDDGYEDRVEITWRDLSTFETGFVVYRTDTGTAVVDTIGETQSNTKIFVDRTGTPGKAYLYQIAAFDIDGEARGESEPSEKDEGIRTLLPPVSVDATDGEFEERVEITWSDESNAEDGYHIYRNGEMIVSTDDNATSAFDTAPQFGAPAQYSVRAFDDYGTSLADSDSGWTMVLPSTSLNASDVYEDRIELRWVDVSEVETGYVLRTDSADVTLHVDTLAANATAFTDVIAVPGVVYEYHLYAFTVATNSSLSSDTGIRPVHVTGATDGFELLKLNASDGFDGDHFGFAVAITDDNLLVVGAPFEDNSEGANAGSAYVFSPDPQGAWTQRAKLKETQSAANDIVGFSVAASGNDFIIGGPGTDKANPSLSNAGAVYFYTQQDTGSFTLSLRTFASDLTAGDFFGRAVDIATDVAIVGAPFGNGSEGKAYIFERVGGVWIENHIFQGFDPAGQFGHSVAIDGDWAMVGAPALGVPWDSSGAVYVFKRDGGGVWNEFPGGRLTPSTAVPHMEFGQDLAISGERAVIAVTGSPLDQVEFAAYVFEYDPASDAWVERAVLKPQDAYDVGFAKAVAISGDRILVHSSGAYAGGTFGEIIQESAVAYLFNRNEDGEWIESNRITPYQGGAFANENSFGDNAVAVSSGGIVIGEQYDKQLGVSSGAVLAAELRKPEAVAASDGTVDGWVRVQWQDLSLTEDGFIIYRDGLELAQVDENVEFYDDAAAQPGRTYEYSVASVGKITGLLSEPVSDFGWRPPNGHITGRVAAQTGGGIPDVSVCLEPSPTRALLLDGQGGHVRIRDDGTFNFTESEDFTVELWFSHAGVDRAPRLISKRPLGGAFERPLDFGLQRSGRVFFTISDGSNVARALSQRNDLNDDTWHHVACVHDAAASELRLFIDGVQEDNVSTSGLGNIANDGDIYIGGYEDSTWFGGQIDELRIWTTARTTPQITANAYTPLSVNEKGLAGYWPFDAFKGGIVTDFAADPQYGEFVGGVYRTNNVAPLDVCAISDDEGSFELTNIRYEENGSSFKLRPSLDERQFSPAVQPVTLNRDNPVENQVVFADNSLHTVVGVVQFAGTDCFQPEVEILVDDVPGGVSDKNGKFTLKVAERTHTIRARRRDYTYWVSLAGDTINTDVISTHIGGNRSDLVFLNQSTFPITGEVGGGCGRYVGDVSIRFRSENNCLDTTFVGNPGYVLDLPPDEILRECQHRSRDDSGFTGQGRCHFVLPGPWRARGQFDR